MRLDVTEKYHYIDKNETKWVYSYQKFGDDEGWFVFQTRPGYPEICIGRVTEDEVEEKVMENPPLTQDDLIDLMLWMNSGGLDEYQPRKEQ